jgi:Domain of unknown function DUF29
MNKHTPAAQEASYEGDFHLWSQTQAALIRDRKFSEIDLENVAEEIETLGRRDRMEIRQKLYDLLFHLLKWQFRRRNRRVSWESAICDARSLISDLIKESPSLKDFPAKILAEEYKDAREKAILLTGLSAKRFPAECPYSIAEIMDDDFLPGA